MSPSALSESLGRPALWISRMRKRFGLPVLEDSRYRRLAVLPFARSSSLELRSHALLSIRSSESWEKEFHWGVSAPLMYKRKRLGGTRHSHSSFRERSSKIFGPEDGWSGTSGRQMGEDDLRLLEEYQILLQEVREMLGREVDVLRVSIKFGRIANNSDDEHVAENLGVSLRMEGGEQFPKRFYERLASKAFSMRPSQAPLCTILM